MRGRRRLLAALAALFVIGPALAVERPTAPVSPGPVPCPSKGQGFVRYPGSAGCVRVSGRVATGMDVRAGYGTSAAPLVAGHLAIDNRADTDLGEVRTYVRIGNGRR